MNPNLLELKQEAAYLEAQLKQTEEKIAAIHTDKRKAFDMIMDEIAEAPKDFRDYEGWYGHPATDNLVEYIEERLQNAKEILKEYPSLK